jgi:hypothetical protein
VARRTHRDVVFVERETSSPLWWLLAGGALGAGLALLFAPEAGEKTRGKLSRRLLKLRDSAEELLDEFHAGGEDSDDEDDAVEPEEEQEEDEAEVDALTEEEAALGDGRKPEGNARAELERRLAAVRARRQRAFADEDEEPVA